MKIDLIVVVIGGVVLWFLLDKIGSLGSGLNDTLSQDMNGLTNSISNLNPFNSTYDPSTDSDLIDMGQGDYMDSSGNVYSY